jgi:hypothetical protein
MIEVQVNNVMNAHISFYSVVVINQPRKNINSQHWLDKILEKCSKRKTKDPWEIK